MSHLGCKTWPCVASFSQLFPHLALVGGHLCKQSLGHLGSLHLLLNFIIDAWCDVDQWLQLQREVRGRAGRLWLGERINTWCNAQWVGIKVPLNGQCFTGRSYQISLDDRKYNKGVSCRTRIYSKSTERFFHQSKCCVYMRGEVISWWSGQAALRTDMQCSLYEQHICRARLHMNFVYRSKSLSPSLLSFFVVSVWMNMYWLSESLYTQCLKSSTRHVQTS